MQILVDDDSNKEVLILKNNKSIDNTKFPHYLVKIIGNRYGHSLAYFIKRYRASNYTIYIANNFQVKKKFYSWSRKKMIDIYIKNTRKQFLEIIGAKFKKLE